MAATVHSHYNSAFNLSLMSQEGSPAKKWVDKVWPVPHLWPGNVCLTGLPDSLQPPIKYFSYKVKSLNHLSPNSAILTCWNIFVTRG